MDLKRGVNNIASDFVGVAEQIRTFARNLGALCVLRGEILTTKSTKDTKGFGLNLA